VVGVGWFDVEGPVEDGIGGFVEPVAEAVGVEAAFDEVDCGYLRAGLEGLGLAGGAVTGDSQVVEGDVACEAGAGDAFEDENVLLVGLERG